LFITIKAEIALILQGASINTHSIITEKEKDSLHFSTSLPSPLPHTHLLFYLSLKKKHTEGGRKKTFSTHSLTLITTHIDTSRLYLYWQNKHRNIRKGSKKKKRKEKRWGDIENFL